MNAIDIIILVVIAGATIYGLYRGLIKQLSSLAAIACGVMGCRLFGDDVSLLAMPLMPDTLNNPTIANFISIAILFILIYLTVELIASLLHSLSHALMLGWLDHLLGTVFCLFKWLLILSIILNVWQLVSPQNPIFSNSTLMDGEMLPGIMNIAPMLFGIVSDSLSSS